MKSVFSLTAVALLCASTSFAQQAPAQTDLLQGQSGDATVDGGGLFAAGISTGAIVGLVAVAVAVVAAAADSDSTNGTN